MIGLILHTVAFIVVMAPLTAVNLLTGALYWVRWVLCGWGMGLLAHWAAVMR